METGALTLVRAGDVYTPEAIGGADILLARTQIHALGTDLESAPELVDEVNLDGLIVAPGLVDAHVHYLGGGGGDGYDSRAPELQLTDFTAHGITTAVAPLGIDPVSRSLEGLLAKARALTQAGMTALIYTGGFRKPLLNLTGSPWRDAYLIPEVRGVKLAIGVERAPAHSLPELADLSRELYWVERATGRRLVIHVHLGPLDDGNALIRELPGVLAVPERLVVTHCNRSEPQLDTAMDLARQGIWTDMTCMISPERGMPESVRASLAVRRMLDAGVAAERITLSTDGNGTVPESDSRGGWQAYRKNMDSLLDEMRALWDGGIALTEVLAMASQRPAEAMGLETKGQLRVGADADLIALDERLTVREVFAAGKRLVSGGRPVVTGRYEVPEE